MTNRMNHSIENRGLVSAHSFKTNTSKERPVLAAATGRCEKCSETIEFGSPICWHRKFGVFHATCYKKLTQSEREGAADSISEDRVAEIALTVVESNNGKLSTTINGLRDRIESLTAPVVSDEKLREIALSVLAESRTLTLNVESKGLPTVEIENAHVSMKQLIFYIQRRKHVYLYGPPGSGKSTAARIAAKATHLEFGYIALNPQTPESRLLGYMDAHGKYVASVLFKLYTKGGVYCIDEGDNMSAALATTLNGLLENNTAAFPHGNFDRHPDFVVVMTGNTAGRGGNAQFPERRVFDVAFAERFRFIFWAYDERQERTIALGINADASRWIDWVQAVRAWAVQHDPRLVVSPRATFEIADAIRFDVLTIEEIVESSLWKGIEKERSARVINAVPFPAAA